MEPKTFICARCGGTFTKGWADDEADAEARQNLQKPLGAPGTAVVCDPCYRAILHQAQEQIARATKH